MLHNRESPTRRRRRRRQRHSPTVIQSTSLLVAGVFLLLVTSFGTPSKEKKGFDTSGKLESNELPGEGSGHWYWAGVVRDAKEVRDETWDLLAQASCEHQIAVHVLTSANKDHAQKRIDGSIQLRRGTQQTCAPILIEEEDELLPLDRTPISNRVRRIALARDVQRERMRGFWRENSPSDRDVVILADLDLSQFPSMAMIAAQAEAISNGVHEDVVCATGISTAASRELRYYDTYSTVLLPDTYVHPLKRRLVKKYYDMEDPRFVRSNDQNGSFTQGDLMRHLQWMASESPTGNAPVRSCFGGLAMYRATTWFAEACRYSDYPSELVRYASEKDGRPCEHVVLHSCLQDMPRVKASAPLVAVNPNLVTLWTKNHS